MIWASLVLVGAACIFVTWKMYRAGQDNIRRKAAEDTIDDVNKANAARDRLRTDPDERKRVRDRFTR